MQLDTELAPELGQVGTDGLILHLGVEIGQDRSTRRRIARRQHTLDRPIRYKPAALLGNGSDGILQPESIVGLSMNVDVRQQAEYRTAPVRASPGVRVVETAVARLGETARHRAHLLGKDVLLRAVAGLLARNALDVDGEPLRQPGVLVSYIRQREMSHLVHQDPIVGQLRFGHVTTNLHANVSAAVAERLSRYHATAWFGHDADTQTARWKATVVARHDVQRSA